MSRHLTLLLVLVGLQANAQNWCAPGAEWLFNFGSMQASGVRRAWYSGDTIVGGQPCQRIDHTILAYEPAPPLGSPFTYQDQPFFTSTQGDLVRLWDAVNSAFDTLAWFGAAPGDHWELPGLSGLTRFDVLDTGTRAVSGILLHYVVVEEPIVMGNVDTLFERIGFEYFYLLPAASLVVDYTTNWLVCYRDDQIAQFDGWFPGGEPCDFHVSVMEHQNTLTQPYPNPGADHLTLSMPAGSHKITIRDAMGRIVLQQRSRGERTSIDTTMLAPGTYVVRVDEGSQRATWVKQ